MPSKLVRTLQVLIIPVLVASVPALVSSYFSYKQAKFEAGVGYETIAKALDQSEKERAVKDGQLAEVKGRVDLLEAYVAKLMMEQRQVAITPELKRAYLTVREPSKEQFDMLKTNRPLSGGISAPVLRARELPHDLDKALQVKK